MKFKTFSIGSIGDLLTKDKFGWVEIWLQFTDIKTNAYPSVQIKVPIQYDRGATLDEVRGAALEKARKVLAAASGLLAEHDLAELQRLDDESQAV